MSRAQLARLLPLPDPELQQVLDYAASLSPHEAADHFTNLLGDAPAAIEFIASFNARRPPSSASAAGRAFPAAAAHPHDVSRASAPPTTTADDDAPPRRRPKKKSQKTPLHALPARPIDATSVTPGTAYQKSAEGEAYMAVSRAAAASTSATTHLLSRPQLAQDPSPAATSSASSAASTPPLPPSAAGTLISDVKPKSKKAATAKVHVAGGVSMQGASTTIAELDAAIRSLELTTNPTRTDDVAKRRCDCIAARHPLLAAAPNCLSCGKVICVKEGLGPCTFCGTPLLSTADVQGMIAELRAERGREKMALDAAAHRKADVSRTPAPFATPRGAPTVQNSLAAAADDAAAQRARAHRDKLLAFQAQNARRTTVRDEAADFETPDAGTSRWASPADRARQLKQQQRVLAQQAWHAQPEYEKRRAVISLDVSGGKVRRRYETVDVTPTLDSGDDPLDDHAVLADVEPTTERRPGVFSQNPLLGDLIRPVFRPPDDATRDESSSKSRTRWRRVQDDLANNEAVILDGGAFAGRDDAGAE